MALACILLLSPLGSAQRVLWDHVGDPDHAQWAIRELTILDDLDGDGIRDFVHGGVPNVHYVRSGADARALHRYVAPNPGPNAALSGVQIENVGDFDSDGFADYAVGAPGHTEPLYAQGAVRVFSGRNHSLLYQVLGTWQDLGYGTFLTGLGDVSGDGIGDFAVQGNAYAFGTGVDILEGGTGALYRTHPNLGVPGGTPLIGSYFSDRDGDGVGDYLLAWPGDSTRATAGGRIEIRSGATGAVLVTGYGNVEHGYAGNARSRAGDWNGDGIEDFVAGAPGAGLIWVSNTADDYAVFVFSGADGSILRGIDGKRYATPRSPTQGKGPAFGAFVASGRDLTGDGHPDLVVGAPLDRNQLGSVFLFSGATGNLISRITGTPQSGNPFFPRVGSQVDVLPDHDGDGIDDWAWGALDYTPPEWTAWFGGHGRLQVVAGAPGEVWEFCDGAPNSTGRSAKLWNSGPITLTTNALELVVVDLPAGARGLFLVGAEVPALPFGVSSMCAGGELHVLGAAAALQGRAHLAPDLGAPAFQTGGLPLSPGDQRTIQYLYLDGLQRNTSNALRILFAE